MKNTFIVFTILSFLFLQKTDGQTLADAVRYSTLEVGGTARTVGIGGGIGALGADFSVLSTNPAGMAAFRRSEFTFTPSFERISTDGKIAGTSGPAASRNKNNFNFNNLGLVFSSQPMNPRWTTAVFGVGFNRLANFHERTYFEGTSPGSITDRWLERSDVLLPNELDAFEEDLAFQTSAIFAPNPLYSSDFLDENGEIGNIPVDKSQLIKRTGSYNELVFSYAGNYNEKFMIGATLGIPFVNFEETRTYRETDDNNNIQFFDELTFTEKVKTSGAGINLKLGVIYRVNQTLRLGAAIHTPTSLGLDDSFSTQLEYGYTEYPDGVNPLSTRSSAESPEGTFEYRLRTPWRAIGSAGVLVKKVGFLSAELEYVNYKSANYNFNGVDISSESARNNEIDNLLTSAINLRLGGEFAFENYRLRAGYALNSSPYDLEDVKVGALSLGAGVRGESIFFDVAYRRQNTESSYIPYRVSIAPEQTINLESVRQQFLATIGFKF